MQGAKKLHRELRFNVKLPAELFTASEEKRRAYKDESVFVQGVIDCIIEHENGSLHLIDYKTDRLARDELASWELGEKRLAKKHEAQLKYYRLAVEKIFGRLPEKTGIYSLHMGKEIPVSAE